MRLALRLVTSWILALLAIDGQSVLFRDQRGFQVLGVTNEGEG